LGIPVAAALCLATLITVSAPPASAAGCSGNLVGHHPVRNAAGELLAHVDIYYDSSTGYNCARLNSYDGWWGRRKWMYIELYTCRETTDPGDSCTQYGSGSRYFDNDGGDFQYYAGPVSVYGRGHCIGWNALSWKQPSSGSAAGNAQENGAGHCG
jgi:hypothetical protein